MKKIITLFMLSFLTSVYAGDTGMKTSGMLAAQLLTEGDPDLFTQQWNRPNPPKIRQITQVTKYQMISSFVVFSGCTMVQGKCNMFVKYSLISPSGQSLQTNVLPLWQDPVQGSQIVLGKQHIEKEIKKTDELGTYQVHATVVDKNSGDIIELNATYDVVKQLDDQ